MRSVEGKPRALTRFSGDYITGIGGSAILHSYLILPVSYGEQPMIGRLSIIRLLLSVVAWISLGLTTALPAVAACEERIVQNPRAWRYGHRRRCLHGGFSAVQQA